MRDEGEGQRELAGTDARDGQAAEPVGRQPAAGQVDEMEGARMNGAGSREGFGSPPWDRAAAETGPDGAETLAEPSAGGPQAGGAQTGGAQALGAQSRGAQTGGAQVGDPQEDGVPGDATAGPSAGDGAGGPSQAETQPGQPAAPGGRRRRTRRRSFWRELPVLIVVALVLALIIKTYAIQAFFIPSGSMQNTLEIGDRVLINKLVYDFRPIHRGDIIVFNGAGSWDPATPAPSGNAFTRFFENLGEMIGISHGEDDYIKRVIGLPGDHVACCDAQGRVTVNGIPLNEQSYLYPGNVPSAVRFNITVPPGRLWVMGDHRAVSYDSRGHMGDPGGGTIPENEVLGRAFVIIWPPSRWRFLPIPATFEQPKLNASNPQASSDAALAAAIDSGTIPVRQDGPELPLVFGFAGAVPVTLLQRGVRRRLRTRRDRRTRGDRKTREDRRARQDDQTG
jgi:signal peptidase I